MSYNQIVEKQREYFLTGETLCFEKRKESIRKIKLMLEENKDAIHQAIFKDLHRDPSTHLEVDKTIAECDICLEKMEEWAAPTPFKNGESFKDGADDLFMVHEPLGVVLVISPWNYPMVCSAPMISALAAGNTVILKPSEISEHFADTIADIAGKYIDASVFTVVKGGVTETTELLKERFDHIIYTGSPPVAKIIMTAAAKHLTPVTLELGGKNPVYISETADLDDAAKKIAIGKIANCGQICLAPDYILVPSSVKTGLLEALERAFEEYGDLTTNPENARIVNQRHFDRIKRLLDSSNGSIYYKSNHELDRENKFIPPHVIEVEKDDSLLKEEIFGPVLPVLEVSSFEEAILHIQRNEKPLGAYIFTKSETEAEQFIRKTSSGGVSVNDVMIQGGTRLMPFGGVGNSGMGRIKCVWGFRTFSHEKPIVVRNGLGHTLKPRFNL